MGGQEGRNVCGHPDAVDSALGPARTRSMALWLLSADVERVRLGLL